MNEKELMASIARNGKSIPKLATEIGIGKKAMYKKIRGETQFTQREISAITKVLHLCKDDMMTIFFGDLVS